MTTRFSVPFHQALSDTGAPLPGAQLYFYASGTSTPQSTYSDAALTVANTNPVVANAGGRFSDIFMGTSTYKAILKNSAGVTIWTADPVNGDTASATAAGSAADNLLINGGFLVNQAGVTSAIDGAYTLDRWYALTQTAAVGVAQQTLTEAGQPTNLRITQTSATAQRIGVAQPVEAKRSQYLRGTAVAFAGRVRCSLSQPLRYAVLEWTGTADVITRDVVLDWTSASYTPGGFFLGANVVVVATGTLTPAANVWTDLPAITGTLSSSTNNLFVMVWTDGTLAQNATVDLGLMQMNAGATASAFTRLPPGLALLLCQRYYETGVAVLGYGAYTVGVVGYFPINWVPKRVTPSVGQSPSGLTNIFSLTIVVVNAGSGYFNVQNSAAGNCAGTSTWTANAEL